MFQHVLTFSNKAEGLQKASGPLRLWLGDPKGSHWLRPPATPIWFFLATFTNGSCNSQLFFLVYWDPLRSPEHWATPNYYVWTCRLLHVATSSLHLIATDGFSGLYTTSRDVSGLYMVSFSFSSFSSFSQVFVSLCLTLSPSKSSTSPWSNPPGWLWSQPGQSHERQVTASHSNLRSLRSLKTTS